MYFIALLPKPKEFMQEIFNKMSDSHFLILLREGVVGGDRGSVKCDRFHKFQLPGNSIEL